MKHTAVRQVLAGVMIYFITIFQVFGQAALLPNAEQQYFDNNGKPLASGSVDYFVPGTTIRKTTWTNSGQTVNNLNPVPLDIGGKGIMYGQGSYRQVVKDTLGNIIWDQPTTAYGASQPSGATGTDTAPVGTVMAYTGFVVPTNWQLAYGQALSRTTFAALMVAITISAPSISCTNTSTTLTGFVDTSLIRIGARIEATCLPTSTFVQSITDATTIVVSNAAAATATVTATIFPWGNGDQVTTFNVPDMRGRSAVGADCMGYVASGNACAGTLTTSFYGGNPGAAGQLGGTQSKNLTIANLNAFTPTGTISTVTPAGTITNGAITVNNGTNLVNGTAGGTLLPGGGSTGALFNVTASQATSTFAGTPTTPTFTGASLGSGTAHSVVNPDATVNYIIKVAPNSTGAGGVVSIGGMFGDIVCDSTMNCAPVAGVNTIGCATATNSQLGCVKPDGSTITISGGVISSIAPVGASIQVATTGVTGGTNTRVLFDNSGVLGEYPISGSGNVAMTANPVFTNTVTINVPTGTNLGLSSTQNITGTTPAGSPSFLNQFLIATDTGNTGSQTDNVLSKWNFGGAGTLGSRVALHGFGAMTTSMDAADTGSIFAGVEGTMQIAGGDNGGSGTEKGQGIGILGSASALSGAFNILAMYGVQGEAFVNSSGATVANRAAFIATDQNGGIQASGADAAYAISATTGSPARFKTGFLVSNFQGSNPINANGAILQTVGSATVTTGLDVSSYTFTGNEYNSANMKITGAGAVQFKTGYGAGFIASDASGNLTSSAFGTGVKTALGVNTNSNGGFPTYIQGTWIPAVTTSATVGTPTYSVQVGSYEQIGRQVTVRFTMILSGWTGSPTGNISITGLPVASSNTTNDSGVCTIGNYNVTGLAASNIGIAGTISPNTSVILPIQQSNTSVSAITAAQFGTTGSLVGMCSYHT